MEDKLGVNSFLMEPIQRLPKYRLLIDQLAKVLSPFLEFEKARLAACARAGMYTTIIKLLHLLAYYEFRKKCPAIIEHR